MELFCVLSKLVYLYFTAVKTLYKAFMYFFSVFNLKIISLHNCLIKNVMLNCVTTFKKQKTKEKNRLSK